MSTPARKRLMRDFKRLQQQDPPAGISGAPQDNNIMLWNAVIFGLMIPHGMEGLSNSHCSFQKIIQTNHQRVGLFHFHGCSIQISLLCDPNPNSPANSEAARMFSESKREYNRRFREVVEQSWTAD
uniref:Uncharacterized protein n=1 Tax=Brassica oleracea var. oleracea TaxID=109376 RepID=A0A0D3E7L4_BRAOL